MDVREIYERIAIAGLRRTVTPEQPHYDANVEFVKQRFREGEELVGYFRSKYGDRELRVLDLGAGAGGVSLALAVDPRIRVTAVDVVLNPDLVSARAEAESRAWQVIASADALPFVDGAFDAVLCLETIEHLPDVAASAHEMMRIVGSGGLVMITTPARLRWLFRGDPHYQVRGLLFLPDAMQRHVVVDRLKRTRDYDVQHIFWTAGGMIRRFPGRARVETLVAIPWPGRPRNVREVLWKIFRRLLWDRIVIWKR